MVFLHGLMGSADNFQRPVTDLIARGVPVVPIDYGKRGTAPIDTSFTELLESVDQVLKASPSSRIDVVGHSLGGHLGLRLANHYSPGTVRTLVGLGPVYRGLAYSGGNAFRRLAGVVMGSSAAELMRAEPWEVSEPDATRVVSIISDADVVVPKKSAELGEVIRITGVRHENLPGLASEVVTALRWSP